VIGNRKITPSAAKLERREIKLALAPTEEAKSIMPKEDIKSAETSTALKNEAKSIAVSVVRLSGEVILENMELGANEKVGVLMKMVEDALGSDERVELLANGSKLLMKASLQESGLVDGDIVTVLTIPTMREVWAQVDTLHGLKKNGSQNCRYYVKTKFQEGQESLETSPKPAQNSGDNSSQETCVIRQQLKLEGPTNWKHVEVVVVRGMEDGDEEVGSFVLTTGDQKSKDVASHALVNDAGQLEGATVRMRLVERFNLVSMISMVRLGSA